MALKLNKRLNIVIEVTQEDESKAFVHSTPVSRQIYDAHALLFGKTVSVMYGEGLSPGMCARMAHTILRTQAEELGVLPAVERTLLPEIVRLTNVYMPSAAGYEMIPFVEVLSRKLLSEDDAAEVQNLLAFFTLASWVHTKEELGEGIYPILQRSGVQTTSLGFTEYRNSLPTATRPANTGVSQPATLSSIPH